MNTKNNRRRASMQKIEAVFVELLETRELHQISVSELCKRAGLNRSTFYANYVDVYGLADAIRERLEARVAELYKDEVTRGYDPNGYLFLFRYIAENQPLFRTYFRLGYDEKYRILTYDYDLAQRQLGSRFIRYHMEFFRGGITRIIKLWLQGGCRETPEEMFGIIKSEYRGREELFGERPATDEAEDTR